MSGRTPKLGGLEERRPVGPGEEVDRVDLAEELDRRDEQRDDDPDRRRDRDERAEGEDDLDRVLAPAPPGGWSRGADRRLGRELAALAT